MPWSAVCESIVATGLVRSSFRPGTPPWPRSVPARGWPVPDRPGLAWSVAGAVGASRLVLGVHRPTDVFKAEPSGIPRPQPTWNDSSPKAASIHARRATKRQASFERRR